LPSQLAAAVNVVPVQLANRQPCAVDHGWQAPAPLQVPAFEQSPPRALLATQSFFGSAPPTGTGEQVPTLPETLQLIHSPPVVASLHAVLQQTPSVQKPLAHWGPLAHDCPAGFFPQELPTQVLGGTQSLSVAQILSHAAELQMNVPHDRLSGVTQVPRPSHVEAGVSEELVAQLEPLQLKPSATYAHLPDLHRPVVPQVDGAVTAHSPCGSGALSATAVHRPSEAGRLHDKHSPVQGVLQQTPCAQLPDWHSVPTPHAAPGGLSPQDPLRHSWPVAHCELSLVQVL
jgi:hypothetical protein